MRSPWIIWVGPKHSKCPYKRKEKRGLGQREQGHKTPEAGAIARDAQSPEELEEAGSVHP